eukprot:sb/3461541/
MRFSTSKYAPPTDKNLDNVYMHLTNYSINKSNKDYDGCDDETKGSKRSIRYLKTWMEANNYSFTTLWSSIEDIVIKTLLVAEPYLMHAYRMARPGTTSAASSSVCFEVLGMDIFVDRKLRPWLLEVNRSPSFGTDSKVDNDIKFDVIRTSFQLLNLKPSEKRKALAAQKQLSQARLLKPRARNERKSQFNVRKTFLRSQLSEVRRVSDQASYEEKHCGNFKKIFPTTGARQTEYVSLLNSAFRTFMAGRGIVLEQKAHSGMMQHLRESELLDMLQQCEQEETAAIQAKMTPAPPPPPVSKTNHKVQPLSKLRPWSSPPPSPFMFSRYSSPSFNSEDNAAFISRNERIRRIRMSEDRSLAIQKSNSILLKQINTLFKQNQELDDQTFRRDLKNATRKGPSKAVPFRSTNKFMFNSIIKYKSKPLLSCSINNLSESSFKLSNHKMRPVFLYDDGLMRFSTSKYAPPTDKNLDNVYMHLTNYSINKSNKDYDGCDDETKGSKRSIRYLKTWMEANNYSFTTLWSSIEDIVIKTLLVAEPYLMHAYRMARPGTTSAASSSVCFEVLGMDIFVDRKLRPWLLEVNRSPSFGTDSKVDNDIKFDVIRTSFQLLNLKPSEKRKALAAQKQLSQARLLKPRARNERKSQFNVRKTFLRSQLSEVRRVSDQASYEEKHCGNFKKIFPTTGARQTEYVSLLNSAFRTFMAGRGIVLEQKAHSGMMQHLRESELLDMLQQCEQEETAAIQAKMTPAPPPPPVSKTNHKVQPLSKLRPWSSPPPSPFMFSRYSSPSFNSEDNAAFISRNERIRRIRMSEDRSLAIQKSNSILLKQINTLFKQNQELDDQTFRRDLKNATRKGPSKAVPFRSTNKFMFNSIIKYKSKPLLSCSINNLSESSFKLSNHKMRPTIMDQTKRPLKVPPEFTMYAEKNDLFALYERLIQDVIVSQPLDPLEHMINFLHKGNDDVPQTFILGPPATGKASIGRMIAKESGVKIIDEPELLAVDIEAVKVARESVDADLDIPGDTLGALVKEQFVMF